MSDWGFYGRDDEIATLKNILGRGRWFFVKMSGRRRIGKTSLIRVAVDELRHPHTFYVQIPAAGPAGVLSAFRDALGVMGVDSLIHQDPTNLLGMARAIEAMVEAGYVVVLDEFQYFHRKALSEFPSYLQAVVDRFSSSSGPVTGGLVVLGSVYTEMKALLDNRGAPLYNRTTHQFDVGHLDPYAVHELIAAHAEPTPQHILFLWNLFEGVPKFYRDCYEQGVIAGDREDIIEAMFFGSSSPLRYEARDWFMSEFRGEFDTPLRYVAEHPGCTRADINNHMANLGTADSNIVGVYLHALAKKYQLIEKRIPLFASTKSRKGRFYVRDNFLRSWLAAVARNAEAQDFRPIPNLVSRTNSGLETAEGFALEQLAGALYDARSRSGVGDFPLTDRVQGFWSRDTEIDLVAVNDEDRRIRFGTCRRSPAKLVSAVNGLDGHIERFLKEYPGYRQWSLDKVAISVTLDGGSRGRLVAAGVIPQDLSDLLLRG